MSDKPEIVDPVDDYAIRIIARWHESIGSIFEVAALCAEANRCLSLPDKKRLFGRLPFSKSAFSKLVAIGRDQRISRPEVRKLLPASFSSIYEITLLKNEQLDAAVEKKILNPKMKRVDISRFRGELSQVAGHTPLYATLYLTKDLSEAEFATLRGHLDQLSEHFGLKLSLPIEAHKKRMAAWEKRTHNYIWRESKKVLDRYIGHQIRDRANPNFRRTMPEEEKIINAASSEEEILFALDSCGEGYQFEEIKRDALNLYPPPQFSLACARF